MQKSLLIVFLVVSVSLLAMANEELDRCLRQNAQLQLSVQQVELAYLKAYGAMANEGRYNPNDIPEYQTVLVEKAALVENSLLCAKIKRRIAANTFTHVPEIFVVSK